MFTKENVEIQSTSFQGMKQENFSEIVHWPMWKQRIIRDNIFLKDIDSINFPNVSCPNKEYNGAK